ncbi:O-antigen ligase [Sulfitobacter brevis]|uniref:O-antigen ligase n=1 Tax=Sulfitobacter brevis TaxID=74348 RepID=A0A1I2FD35_9RHOB|nr:O-antigen ligase family protein [Sulfitobacter brevis]SFF03145.1 O-antigen ligase [Sulfitobacter brevis]
MWMLVSLLAIATSLVLVMRQMRVFGDDRLARAIVLLIWVRFALTALGEPALRTVAAGQSILALGTFLAVIIVLFLLPLDQLRRPRLLPFAMMAGVVLLSALFNDQIGALLNTGTLWIMFTLIVLLVHRALQVHGGRAVLGCLLAVFSLPIGLQLAGFALGRSQVGMDGSVSFIGNYVHEAVFSTVALCAVWLVTIYPWQKRTWLLWGFAVVMTSMFLANYRTLILACVPSLIATIVVTTRSSGKSRSALPLFVALALMLAAVPLLQSERFSDLGTAIGQLGNLAKPSQEFTAAEKDLLSARLYIGAAYLDQYANADLLRKLIGFGPGADKEVVGTHPHNEFLRMLFETGLVGLLLWLAIIAGLVASAIRRATPLSLAVLSGGYGALVIGGFGTSFFIRPEGIIFVALLVAVTWHLTERQPDRRSRPCPQQAIPQ